MSQDRLQCKECGTVDSTKFTLFKNAYRCNVCGAINPLYENFDVVEIIHSGEVKVEGIPSVSSLLLQARKYLDGNDYDKATKLYKRVIEIDSENHVAWWGRYCCEKGVAAYYRYRDKYGNSGPRVKANILCDLINEYGMNAINNAPEEYAQAYRKALKADIQFVEDVCNGKYN